jgi:hypothetical protein
MFGLVVATVHSAASSRVELRCEPVALPELKPCGWGLYRDLGYVPNRCRNT